jgi:membrane associated rhomboid family serine protease
MLQSGRVREGEWWRLLTALTLHADLQHLLGNLAIGGIFILLLCRQLGSGLAWVLLLGAGTLGNLINAFLQPLTHNSVGASTAVFGAVGVFAATSVVRYRHHLSRRWPLPVAAALSLLAVLGSEGKNTDLGAHLFGLLAGGALGVTAEQLMIRYGYPGRRLNLLLALFSVVLVVTAWYCALESIFAIL